MAKKAAPDLFASSHWIIMMGIVAALVTAQWHQETLPIVALIAVLCLTVLKARLIILDFMCLRGSRPVLVAALLAWPVLFISAVAIKAAAGL